MIIGPRYKIARRLGAPIFEKTQTQKYATRAAEKSAKKSRGRARTDYGIGMIEKQKARLSYGLSAKQFENYVKASIAKKGSSSTLLVRKLEGRLDNVVLRAGFANTRAFARQMVSHGHITVNGKKVNIPSYQVAVGETVGIREGSQKKAMFANLDERLKSIKVPAWLKLNFDKKQVVVDGEPQAPTTELLFNVNTVLEFFSR